MKVINLLQISVFAILGCVSPIFSEVATNFSPNSHLRQRAVQEVESDSPTVSPAPSTIGLASEQEISLFPTVSPPPSKAGLASQANNYVSMESNGTSNDSMP